MVVILGAAVAVRADSVKIQHVILVASTDLDQVASTDLDQTDSLRSTLEIALHAPALLRSSWASLGDEDDPTPDHFMVRQWHGRDLHQKFLHRRSKLTDRDDDDRDDIDHAGQVQSLSVASAPVPEPATILMLGTGLCGVIGAARRKLNR